MSIANVAFLLTPLGFMLSNRSDHFGLDRFEVLNETIGIEIAVYGKEHPIPVAFEIKVLSIGYFRVETDAVLPPNVPSSSEFVTLSQFEEYFNRVIRAVIENS